MSIAHGGAAAPSSLEKEPSSEALVRMRDCDPFGHLHHSRYIDYFFEARENHLRAFYAFDIYDYGQRTGHSWFVGGNQIRYFAPANFNATVRIVTRLIDHDARRLHLEGRMYRTDGRLSALCWSLFRPVDLRTAAAIDHDPALMELFAGIGAPLEGAPTFEERGRSLTAR